MQFQNMKAGRLIIAGRAIAIAVLATIVQSETETSTAEGAEKARGHASISLPGPNRSYLKSGDDHEALTETALKLLGSTTVSVGQNGYYDSSLGFLFPPGRQIPSSFGSPDNARLKTVTISRLYIDTRNVFGPDEIHAEIDGARRNFSRHALKDWVAFRREFDRVRFQRSQPVVPATGRWSKPVNGIEARLAVENWRDPMIAVYLEIRNRKNLLNTVTIPIDANQMHFELRDKDGKVVPDAGLPRSGPVATLGDFQLPYDSSIRFNLSVSTVGVDTTSNALIPLRSQAWVIKAEDFTEYQLSGSFKADRKRGQNQTVWHGELKIPPVVIQPTARKPVFDRTVSRVYEVRQGQQPAVLTMLDAMFEDEDNVRFQRGEKATHINATASGSRQLFIREIVDAFNSGSSNQETESKRVTLRNHSFKQNHFTFVRMRYTSGDQRGTPRWATDYPDADRAISARLAQWFPLDVNPNGKVLDVTSKDLNAHRFVYLSEPGSLVFTDPDVTAMRDYLSSGGFLMADDFWGEAEWLNLKTQLKRVFPELDPVELPLSHPLFHCVFDLKEKPQVCSIAAAMQGRSRGVTWEREDGREVHYRGLVDPTTGRLMAVLCHNTDLADGWERGKDDPWFAKEFSEKRAFPMGINIVFYALTQ